MHNRFATPVLLALLTFCTTRPAAADVCTWAIFASGDWEEAGNWSCNKIPGVGDDVILNNGSTITLNIDHTVASLSIVVFSGGNLDGPGDLVVSGDFTWDFGTIGGTGTITIGGSASLQSGGSKVLGRVMTLGGDAAWSAGSLFLRDAVVIEIGDGTTFTASHNGDVSVFRDGTISTEPQIVVLGTFLKDAMATPGTTDIGVVFNNENVVQVVDGTLRLGRGGTHASSFEISAAAVLAFNGGSHEADGTSFTGAGLLRISGFFDPVSMLNLNAGTTVSTDLEVSQGGTVGGVQRPILNLNTDISPASYTQSHGTLDGTGHMQVTGPVAWTGGTMQGTGTVTANGLLTISGTAAKSLTGRTLSAAADADWSEGNISMGDGAVIENQNGSTFTASHPGAANMSMTDTPVVGPVFNNLGTFVKEADSSPGTSLFLDVAFNNQNAVEVNNGTLSLAGGGMHASSFDVAGGATLAFDKGIHEVNGSTFTGAGTVRVESFSFSVTVNFNAMSTVDPAFRVGLGDIIGGTGDVLFNGPLTIGQSTLQGAGTLTAANTTTINGTVTLTGRTLLLDNDANWTSGGFFMGEAAQLVIPAGRTFTATSGNDIDLSGTPATMPVIQNAGTFVHNPSGTSSGSDDFEPVFNNTGLLQQVKRKLNLKGGGTHTGTFDVNGTTSLDFAGGTHDFTGGATFTGSGDLHFSGGVQADFGSTDPDFSTHVFVSGATTTVSGTDLTFDGISLSGGTFQGPGAGAGAFSFNTATLSGTNTLAEWTARVLSSATVGGTYNLQDAVVVIESGATATLSSASIEDPAGDGSKIIVEGLLSIGNTLVTPNENGTYLQGTGQVDITGPFQVVAQNLIIQPGLSPGLFTIDVTGTGFPATFNAAYTFAFEFNVTTHRLRRW